MKNLHGTKGNKQWHLVLQSPVLNTMHSVTLILAMRSIIGSWWPILFEALNAIASSYLRLTLNEMTFAQGHMCCDCYKFIIIGGYFKTVSTDRVRRFSSGGERS